MSWWTYIRGSIIVAPLGRTQPEKTYILDTVLEHLPRVTGSEGDMEIYVNQVRGHNSSSSHDEFGMRTNNLIDYYGQKSRRGWHETQSEYIITVNASLRDRHFEETKREFIKWLTRLAKRVIVRSVLVTVEGDYHGKMIINEKGGAFYHMFEDTSWYQMRKKEKHPEPNWCEYLMWERGAGTDMPMKLCYKYYADEENDKETERRMEWAYDN
jgi:hypothetical protein